MVLKIRITFYSILFYSILFTNHLNVHIVSQSLSRLAMAAFTGWRAALANRCGTDMAKPSWPRGRNTHDETQAAMWQGGATPQQRAHA